MSVAIFAYIAGDAAKEARTSLLNFEREPRADSETQASRE